ncbi:GumC domain-containing protein [Sediminibacterium soli]|uniref:lipopolysaccharide biosynthesis protein n=1 Tax=Sediminibacterium soli TaxID=2698829 RepID=UPI00137ABE3D|nr:lipopolysaccharide biosynthesis protein [Sediminibacterium soli]NCI48085.1 lipopolysaccharide biosynthesis protein [Sediminibacterium soli]
MNPHVSNKEEISIKDVIRKIKEWFVFFKVRWAKILLISALSAALFLGYSFLQKPIYIATLSFALEDDKAGGGLNGALGLASQFGIDLGTSAGGAFSGANITELIKSRVIIERALLSPIYVGNKEQSLVEYYISYTKMRDNWKGKPLVEKIAYLPTDERSTFTLQKDSILGVIYETIKSGLVVTQKDKKVSIISIEAKTGNELCSKYFVESLAKEVSDFYIDTKSKKARMNVQILERQADSIRSELNRAIGGVAVANDVTFNLNSAYNSQRVASTKKQVDVQANTAILTQLVTNLELARITLRKETPLIQIIDKPILPLKIEKFGKKKALLVGGFLGFFIAIVGMAGIKIIKQEIE